MTRQGGKDVQIDKKNDKNIENDKNYKNIEK